jgi:hypothetical protein
MMPLLLCSPVASSYTAFPETQQAFFHLLPLLKKAQKKRELRLAAHLLANPSIKDEGLFLNEVGLSPGLVQCTWRRPGGELQPEYCWCLLAEQAQFARLSFNTFSEQTQVAASNCQRFCLLRGP